MKKLMNNPRAIRGLFAFALIVIDWLSYRVPLNEFKESWAMVLVGFVTTAGLLLGIIYHEGKKEEKS